MSTATAIVSADEKKVLDLVDQLLAEFPPKSTDPTTFLGAQFDRGLAWVHFDEVEDLLLVGRNNGGGSGHGSLSQCRLPDVDSVTSTAVRN
jgi:hypothetical protein